MDAACPYIVTGGYSITLSNSAPARGVVRVPASAFIRRAHRPGDGAPPDLPEPQCRTRGRGTRWPDGTGAPDRRPRGGAGGGRAPGGAGPSSGRLGDGRRLDGREPPRRPLPPGAGRDLPAPPDRARGAAAGGSGDLRSG